GTSRDASCGVGESGCGLLNGGAGVAGVGGLARVIERANAGGVRESVCLQYGNAEHQKKLLRLRSERRGTAEERAKARAKTAANLSEDECTAEAEPKCIVYTAAPNVQALPGGARFCKQGSDDRGALGDGV